MNYRLLLVLSVAGAVFTQTAAQAPQPDYDLLLKGGHVIDGKNHLSAVRDVAIKDGKIAAVAANIAASRALKTVDVAGLYVTPGLVDIHVHVYRRPEPRPLTPAATGAFHPDGFTLRSGRHHGRRRRVGRDGATFEDFKKRIIDSSEDPRAGLPQHSRRRHGSGAIEQNLDGHGSPARHRHGVKYKGVIVGIKSAHFNGPEWTPYEHAEEIGKHRHIPVMVDFGGNVRAGRTLYDLLNKYFRPGDIFTHCTAAIRGEQDPDTKGPARP